MEVVGVTTVLDSAGARAGYVREVLRLAGRSEVPVAAGAQATLSANGPPNRPPRSGVRNWPTPVAAAPGPLAAACVDGPAFTEHWLRTVAAPRRG